MATPIFFVQRKYDSSAVKVFITNNKYESGVKKGLGNKQQA